ncbi:MAG TPA: HdeD family acid-resistance protein [Candidatus Angelobacter sp.]|nr:HdeD family acid-resistance protein [Candidatus Angelobacter sp.]
MSIGHTLRDNLSGEVKSRAGWGIFLGIVTVLLGILLLAFPLATATVTTIVLGAVLIVVGVIDLVQALRSHTAGNAFLRLLLGIGYGFVGILLIANPLWGVAVLTIILGAVLLFEAAMALILAFQTRPASGWGWLLFDAVITALLGILILAHWPASAIWAIGTLVGVAVLMRGITRIALSIGLRRVVGRVEDRDRDLPRAA